MSMSGGEEDLYGTTVGVDEEQQFDYYNYYKIKSNLINYNLLLLPSVASSLSSLFPFPFVVAVT